MSCKDCIHYDVCLIVEISANKDEEDYYTEFGCDDFKNKADFVEVKCRCKDCKYYRFRSLFGKVRMWCDKHTYDEDEPIYVKPDDFCSYGERKL